MTKLHSFAFCAVAAGLVALLTGCNTKLEEGKSYAVLKKGQQVSADMVGWVAVRPSFAEQKTENGVKYAVLSSGDIIEPGNDGWTAVNPEFFAKLSGITVAAPAGGAVEKWVLKPEGKSIPKDKDGWVALPFSEPKIEGSANRKGREMAVIAAGNIVPKEMNGWAAVDAETLSTLVGKFMLTGTGARTEKQ